MDVDARKRAAREILAFYLEAGVDALLGEAPVDRLAEGESLALGKPEPPSRPSLRQGQAEPPAASGETPKRPLPPLIRSPAPPPLNAPPPPDQAVMAAREAARSAATLDELRGLLETFEGCALKLGAMQLVFADGNPSARVMLVGEAPGEEEDRRGLPFVGKSGKLLDLMLAAIGLDRTSVYIANVLPWRPPGNRTPTPQETQICLPFTKRQIELADPDILVCMGKPAMQALLGVNEGIRKMRGRWMPYHTGKREIRALPTFHPAYLLRSPLEKRYAWRDLLAIKRALES